ncbi:MAG: uridine kinase [Actinomycetia bacterium]|nr:uridine kinase [Actinomycetes bacterium]
MSRAPRTVVLLAGPSGSGKSRLARLSGLPSLRLDDFYRDEDAPGLPRLASGVVDWDDPATWDDHAAATALVQVARRGVVTTPAYDISASRSTGTRTTDLGDAPAVIAEGIFATQLAGLGAGEEDADVPVWSIWLDRPRLANWWRRLRRDLHDHRKPVPVLLSRGVLLCRREPGLRAAALARGFTPMTMAEALARLESLGGQASPPASVAGG